MSPIEFQHSISQRRLRRSSRSPTSVERHGSLGRDASSNDRPSPSARPPEPQDQFLHGQVTGVRRILERISLQLHDERSPDSERDALPSVEGVRTAAPVLQVAHGRSRNAGPIRQLLLCQSTPSPCGRKCRPERGELCLIAKPCLGGERGAPEGRHDAPIVTQRPYPALSSAQFPAAGLLGMQPKHETTTARFAMDRAGGSGAMAARLPPSAAPASRDGSARTVYGGVTAGAEPLGASRRVLSPSGRHGGW